MTKMEKHEMKETHSCSSHSPFWVQYGCTIVFTHGMLWCIVVCLRQLDCILNLSTQISFNHIKIRTNKNDVLDIQI